MLDQFINQYEFHEQDRDTTQDFALAQQEIADARNATQIYFRGTNAMKPAGSVVHCPNCGTKFKKVHARHAFCNKDGHYKCWRSNYFHVVMRGLKRFPKFMRIHNKKG